MARLAISLAGAVVGNFIAPGIGGQIGFALGSVAGGLLFQEDLPPQVGPKIEDGKVSSSAYGQMVPMVWGTIDVAGNIIDAGPLITESHTEETDAKGGPTQESTTYTQYMDYCVAINAGCDGIVKIYANEQLIYNASPDSTVQRPEWLNFTFYEGSDIQDVDPTFEAFRGVTNVPAYRDTSYVVFRRLKVTEFGTTAINFRFVVTTNGTPSTSTTTYDQGEAGPATSIVHNEFTDLMIGSVTRDINLDGTEQMLVAIEPYSRTEVWKTNINDAATYGTGYWVMQCGFQYYDASGLPVYPPNSVIAVYHHQNSSLPLNRFLRFFNADSGIEIGFVAIHTSESNPKIVSAYSDDAVFYQRRTIGAPAVSTMRRHAISFDLSVATVSMDTPDGYLWYDVNNNSMWVKPGSRSAGTVPVVLAAVENDTTGDFGFVSWEDHIPGLGASTDTPTYNTPDEFPSYSGDPRDGVYDPGEDCFWVMSFDTVTYISRVELDGSITSTTNFDTAFSISGAASSITIDTSRDLLWVVIGGVAYSWPTFDLSQTPIAYGSGLSDDSLVWHPYSGTLFAGTTEPLTEAYYQYQLSNLTGGGVSLQQVVEEICDEPGTNLTTGDRDCTALSAITVDGFRIATVAQRRAAIDTLRSAYLFDFVPRSGVMTAILRGGSSAATLDDDDLGAHVYGTSPVPLLKITREAEERLPSKVGVSFIDASQNYEAGYEHATRQASQGGTESKLSLAVVLSHDDAAQLASVALHARHVEAEKYEVSCMPSLRDTAVPAAVITAAVNDAEYPMLLDSASIVDGGIIQCAGARYDASVYTDFTVGGTTRDRLRSVEAIGTTQLIALDIPAMRDVDLQAGYYVAGASYSPTWDGAVVFDSADGLAYSDVATLNAEATYGFLTAALPTGETTDLENTLTVRLVSGSLSSLSDTNFQTDKISNYAAIGASGRWEIIRFQNASESDGVYSLTTLIRGLRDTLGSIGYSVAGDKFVLLDTATMRLVAIQQSYIGDARWLKAVSIGKSVDGAAALSFTPSGRSLRPFRPACLDAQLSGSDWVITWDRQDRMQARFLQQPQMSESSEAYSVDILDLGSNVVRTFTSGSETETYTSAQQTADWGTATATIKYRACQVSSVVGNGPYTYGVAGKYSTDYDALITARGSLIEFWPLDDASGTTATSDSGSHDGTYTNMSSSINAKALLLDGSPSVQFNPTGNDDVIHFTEWSSLANTRAIEFWIEPAAFSGTSQYQAIIWHSTSNFGGGNGWAVCLDQNGYLRFVLYNSSFSTLTTDIPSGAALEVGTLYHVVINFAQTSGDDVDIYINGLLSNSGTVGTTITMPTAGQFAMASLGQHLQSYVSKVALYSASLTNGDMYNSVIRGTGI